MTTNIYFLSLIDYKVVQNSHMPIISLTKIILFFLLIINFVSCSNDQNSSNETTEPLSIPVIEVTAQDIPVAVEFVGQTKGAVDAEVRARVEGVILGVHFDEGKEVIEGQLLYTIDPAPFEAKFAEAKAKLAQAQAVLTKAEKDLNRIRPLAQMNAVSKRDLDTAIAVEGSASANIEAANAAVKSAEIDLSYTKVTAPVSGMIGLSKVKVGELVGQPPRTSVLTTVSKLDPIHVQFSVNEKEYLFFSRLRQKQQAAGVEPEKRKLELVLADGSIHTEKGEVISSEAQVNATTGSLTVEASFPNPGKILRPGQFAKIKTVGETIKSALVIPKKAIKELQGQYQVFVVDSNNIVQQRTIKPGTIIKNMQIVESGLAAKERIALEAIQGLKSGMTINPRIETTPG